MGPDAMDIGQVSKGKGRWKGKGQGKGKDVVCFKCGGQGHIAPQCHSESTEKGKGKGKDHKGKVKLKGKLKKKTGTRGTMDTSKVQKGNINM